MCQHVDGFCDLVEACAAPFVPKNFISSCHWKSLLCLLPSGAMARWFVVGETFFFPLFSLCSLQILVAIQNFRVFLLVIDISTSIFIILILIFCSWSFCKLFYLFLISSFNPDLWHYFFQFSSHSFDFFVPLVKLIFFQFYPSIKNL